MGEARGLGLKHQVFFCDDGGLGMAEAGGLVMGDGDDAVTREGVRELETVAESSGGVGDEGGRPRRAGVEVLAEQIGEFREIPAAADEEALVVEGLHFGVLSDE